MIETGIPEEEFKALMTKFAAGVTVVTTRDSSDKAWGLTATAFTSVSLKPPLCLVCIDKNTASHDPIREAGVFAVNFLSAEQEDVSNTFASRRDDKFDQVKNEPGPATGCPVFPESLAWLECETKYVYEGGDHNIFVGEIKKTSIHQGNPLLYWNGCYGDIKSRPKNW